MERYPYCCTVQKTFLLTIWSSLSLPFFFGRIIFERMGFLLLLKPWFDRPHCIQKRRKRRKRRSEFAAVPTVQKKGAVGRPENCTSRDPPSWQVEGGRGGEGRRLWPFFRSPFPSSLQFSFRRRRTKTKKSTSIARTKFTEISEHGTHFSFASQGSMRYISTKCRSEKKILFFPVHL